MRIASVTPYRLRIPFKSAFSHALCSRGETETIVLAVTSDAGETGIGEILPRAYLTGETLDSVLAESVPAMVRRWTRLEFDDAERVVAELREELSRCGRSLAAYAGWELALLDLAGKSFNFAAGDVVGPEVRGDLEPGVVIDFNVSTGELERHCRMLRLRGRRHIKVKVGLADDVRRIAIIQETFGLAQALRLDANAAWTADAAVEVLRQLRGFNIASVEQPVPAPDLDGMRQVREKTGIPVVADESLCSLSDAERLIAVRAADVFNIRVAKCGGLLGSARLVARAREAGLRCHLGTLVGETGILSRAAEILGSRLPDFDFLEGKGQNKFLLGEDVVEPARDTSAGLGIYLLADRIAKWQLSAVATT